MIARSKNDEIKMGVLLTGTSGFIARRRIADLLRSLIKVKIGFLHGAVVNLPCDNAEVVHLYGQGTAAKESSLKNPCNPHQCLLSEYFSIAKSLK